MLVTWRSTAATVTTSWCATPALESPSAMSASTSVSRLVRRSRGLLRRCRPHQAGNDAEGPALEPPSRATGACHLEQPQVADLFLEQVTDPLEHRRQPGRTRSDPRETGTAPARRHPDRPRGSPARPGGYRHRRRSGGIWISSGPRHPRAVHTRLADQFTARWAAAPATSKPLVSGRARHVPHARSAACPRRSVCRTGAG